MSALRNRKMDYHTGATYYIKIICCIPTYVSFYFLYNIQRRNIYFPIPRHHFFFLKGNRYTFVTLPHTCCTLGSKPLDPCSRERDIFSACTICVHSYLRYFYIFNFFSFIMFIFIRNWSILICISIPACIGNFLNYILLYDLL